MQASGPSQTEPCTCVLSGGLGGRDWHSLLLGEWGGGGVCVCVCMVRYRKAITRQYTEDLEQREGKYTSPSTESHVLIVRV